MISSLQFSRNASTHYAQMIVGQLVWIVTELNFSAVDVLRNWLNQWLHERRNLWAFSSFEFSLKAAVHNGSSEWFVSLLY